MSSLYEHEQLRREVEELHRLAMDAHREAQYATMERLLEQAATTAERLDDLSLLIKERYWLADARRMQSKHAQAISTSTWLIGLATDPTQNQQLHDAQTLKYLAQAFMDFVESGRFLALPVQELLQVVADGLDWLERIGKANWTAGLRTNRGSLFKDQQHWQQARQEMEVALALARRHPEAPGYALAAYLLDLADLLLKEQVGAYAEAIPLAEEVLTAAGNSNYERYWAYKVLANAHLGLHEHETALQAARQSLAMARSIESSLSIFNAYQVLDKIYRTIGRLTDAASAAAHQWRWATKNKRIDVLYEMLVDCISVRLLQAREACNLSLNNEDSSYIPPLKVDRKLAQRRLASAHRLILRARLLASQLDQAQDSHSAQDVLDKLARQAEQLANLLEREAAS